jgi:serine/threonine protein kinase
MKEKNNRIQIFENPIGKGSYGEVYVGMDLLTGKKKAIKIMDKKNESIYENEVYILNKISKPGCFRHIICLTDYFVYDEKVVIITDKIEGISLNEFLNENLNMNLKSEELIFIIFQLIYTMRYMHDKLNIAHLDIKPANIMINPVTLEIGIIDFGLGCEKKCITGGTISYMSPEYYERFIRRMTTSIDDGKKTDIYALGTIIYQLVFGKDSIKEYGKSIESRHGLLYKYLNNKRSNIMDEYKDIRDELMMIFTYTLNPNELERIVIGKLYEKFRRWKNIYKTKMVKNIKKIENEKYIKTTNDKMIPLINILSKKPINRSTKL